MKLHELISFFKTRKRFCPAYVLVEFPKRILGTEPFNGICYKTIFSVNEKGRITHDYLGKSYRVRWKGIEFDTGSHRHAGAEYTVATMPNTLYQRHRA